MLESPCRDLLLPCRQSMATACRCPVRAATLSYLLLCGISVSASPHFASELVFPLHPQHNHAPGIVEFPDGDLLVSWYRGSGERRADDVAVYGARLRKGSTRWSAPFLMVDVPGFPDGNTALFVDGKKRLWLFWPTVLANTWESCITNYRVSTEYSRAGAPIWDWQGTILLKPMNFQEEMLRGLEARRKLGAGSRPDPGRLERLKTLIGEKLSQRLGWQPRCKPTVLPSGRVLLPLYSDTYSVGIMAISDDEGRSWYASQPLAGFGSIQPSVLRRDDGTLVAYMRENGPLDRIRISESRDDGIIWGPVGVTDLPNPGSGLDGVRLASGNWVLVYNDTTGGRRSLAVSLSDDEGRSWNWTRHLERHASGSYHYPAVIQARDGVVHVAYSYFVEGGKSMKHAAFNEEWIRQEDGEPRDFVPGERALPRGYTLPLIDLARQKERQVIVDREPGKYLGHPTTVLLEDKRTMIAVYPTGHGRGRILMKRSADAGLTWSPRLRTPENWATSKEVPTIYRVVGPDGKRRLILFSGLYPARMSVSEDDGHTWTSLTPIGDWGGIVVMGSVVELRTGRGHYLALFHDDGRFFRSDGKRTDRFTVYKTRSTDGGLTWSFPEDILSSRAVHLCEPGIVRSPDGKQLAVLFRENSRRRNSWVIFSDDEGKTWTTPRELPASLTGDRHTGKYGPDGRLFISFRDTTLESATAGDWVGWVGTYEDIRERREGQYRVRLMDNLRGRDCAYPGVEALPDGTFVTTTYGHWIEGESPFIVSVRFTLQELDELAARTK